MTPIVSIKIESIEPYIFFIVLSFVEHCSGLTNDALNTIV